jgi:chloramphenicol 3-O phosphotransferase
MILLLNGASSSGKTALARALQRAWAGPLLHLGIDTAVAMLPAHYVGMGAKASEGIEFYADQDEHGPVLRLRYGTVGRHIEQSLARMAQGLAQDGHDLVLDLVILDTETLKTFVQALADLPLYFIGVQCDLAVLEARELARGDRFLNSARPQHAAVHAPPRHYDLVVDTSRSGPYELAAYILAHVATHPMPTAFAQLRRALV